MDRPLYALVHDACLNRRTEAARQDAVTAVCRENAVTLTQGLGERDRNTKMRVMRALLGTRFDDATGGEYGSATPLLPTVQLRSLQKNCPDCKKDASGECGRKQGEYHDVVYKTGLVSGNAKELHDVQQMDGTINVYAVCKVNPATGEFLEPVRITEAVKILTQFGRHTLQPAKRRKTYGIVEEIAHKRTDEDNEPRRLSRASRVIAQ